MVSKMSLAAVDFDYLRELVKTHSAIVIDAGKEYLAEARLAPLVSDQGCSSVQELLSRLRTQPFNGLHRQVLDAMTNNETWFFRDANPFQALTSLVIPDLIKRRESERKISIWSAACSSGQEPYSVAMTIRENFLSSGWSFSILGTDFCTTVLERARTGLYRQMEVNRGLSARLLTKYFVAARTALAAKTRNSDDGDISLFEPFSTSQRYAALHGYRVPPQRHDLLRHCYSQADPGKNSKAASPRGISFSWLCRDYLESG